MNTYTKETLIAKLKEIRELGFIPSARPGNDGSVGNTLEDLLGIQENNLPIPNAAEWELKTQRIGTTSLTTLFHLEPSPRAMKLVAGILLPKYSWRHKEAGKKYQETERSFRQTIHGLSRSDRGFKVAVNDEERKILISFDAEAVAKRHYAWLKEIEVSTGLNELSPQPYWGFDDLFHKAGTKLLNCFFVQAKVIRKQGQESYHYEKIQMLKGFNIEKFVQGIREGYVLVDFDARTGHNHGTHFRLRRNRLPDLYESAEEI